MSIATELLPSTETLSQPLRKLREFCFPNGEDAALSIKGARLNERGQMRTSADARWIPFVAEQTICSNRSNFYWEAKLDPGKPTSVTLVDAFQEGRGALSVMSTSDGIRREQHGGELDIGELQRYLASIFLCPPILLNHKTLKWTEICSYGLRIQDAESSDRAAIEFDLAEDGKPLLCRANRPRLAGHEAIFTPWYGTYSDFHEFAGFRIPTRLEAFWMLPSGPFCYYQSEITTVDWR